MADGSPGRRRARAAPAVVTVAGGARRRPAGEGCVSRTVRPSSPSDRSRLAPLGIVAGVAVRRSAIISDDY